MAISSAREMIAERVPGGAEVLLFGRFATNRSRSWLVPKFWRRCCRAARRPFGPRRFLLCGWICPFFLVWQIH